MDFMESSVEMVRRRLRKVWKIWWWSAEEDETVSLIDGTVSLMDDSSATLKSVQVESSVSQEEGKKKKKKSWRKRMQKLALNTCKFIGMGAETLSAPGFTPNPYFLSYSFNQRVHFSAATSAYYDHDDHDVEYQMYTYNLSGLY